MEAAEIVGEELGGYLHQDWDLDFPSWEAAVAAFRAQSSRAERERLVLAIESLLGAARDDETLQAEIWQAAGLVFDPASAGLRMRDWLDRVAAALREPAPS